jgi:hypothetical protein
MGFGVGTSKIDMKQVGTGRYGSGSFSRWLVSSVTHSLRNSPSPGIFRGGISCCFGPVQFVSSWACFRRLDLLHAGAGPKETDIARPAEFLIDSSGTIRWVNLTEKHWRARTS